MMISKTSWHYKMADRSTRARYYQCRSLDYLIRSGRMTSCSYIRVVAAACIATLFRGVFLVLAGIAIFGAVVAWVGGSIAWVGHYFEWWVLPGPHLRASSSFAVMMGLALAVCVFVLGYFAVGILWELLADWFRRVAGSPTGSKPASMVLLLWNRFYHKMCSRITLQEDAP